MYNYTLYQWLAFFAVYCFFGWIFESIYVSVEYRKFVNRGFLYGPVIPIYGFGSIIILFFTAPFKENVLLTFISGMLAATLLEYMTGYTMEKLFGVRYWDYTYEPLNLNGYICLGCSLMWGMFSVVVTNYIHKPVDRFVTGLNATELWLFDLTFLVFFSIDVYESTLAAFDLKKLFKDYVENNETVIKLQKRLDVLLAFAENDYRNLLDKMDEKKKEYEDEYNGIKAKLEAFGNKYFDNKIKSNRRVMNAMKRNPGMSSKAYRFELDKLKKGLYKK